MRFVLCALAFMGGGCSVLLDFEWHIDGGPVVADAAPLMADPYEPNESFDDATGIGVGTFPDLTIFPMTDVDFYKFTLTDVHDVTVAARFIPERGDLDLYLYRWDAAKAMLVELTNSTHVDSDEELGASALPAGDYGIKVQSFSAAHQNWYELVLGIN